MYKYCVHPCGADRLTTAAAALVYREHPAVSAMCFYLHIKIVIVVVVVRVSTDIYNKLTVRCLRHSRRLDKLRRHGRRIAQVQYVFQRFLGRDRDDVIYRFADMRPRQLLGLLPQHIPDTVGLRHLGRCGVNGPQTWKNVR